MGVIASHNTSLTIVYSNVYSGADQRKHQSSGPLAFVRGIHRWPGNIPHKWPVTRKMFPLDDVIMDNRCLIMSLITLAWIDRAQHYITTYCCNITVYQIYLESTRMHRYICHAFMGLYPWPTINTTPKICHQIIYTRTLVLSIRKCLSRVHECAVDALWY